MQNIFTQLQSYWGRRSVTYSLSSNREYNHWQNKTYADIFTRYLPEKENLKVLDIGCGPGFFSMVLSAMGHRVTGIDLTEEMLIKAANNLLSRRLCADFIPMNAQKLDFDDNTYDVAVTRNLTWNLPDPHTAYREWHRVLKPGGILLNFDANWYRYLYQKEMEHLYRQDQNTAAQMGLNTPVSEEMIKAMEDIALNLPLSSVNRPEWDVPVLKEIGFSQVDADEAIAREIYTPEEKILYRTADSFLIIAKK